MNGRIAYVGNFRQPWTTETHVAASLQDLGFDVVELQEDEVRIPEIERAADGCDLLLYTRTWGLLASTGRPCMAPHPTREGLDLLARLRVPSASWHLDLYAGLRRAVGLRSDPFWRTRYVFTPDGDPDSQAFFEAEGVRHLYLRPGVFGPDCYLAEPRSDLEADVVFVGSGSPTGDYHGEWPYRARLLGFLAGTYRQGFVKHGHPPLNGGVAGIRGHALNQLYASARVVVGDTLCLGPGTARTPPFAHRGYWSDRVYETLGRGGFLIHPRIAGLEEEFADGEHLVLYDYGDLAGLRERIDHYLARPEERERIRRVGHERVRARCTYAHRARQVLATLAAHEPGLRALGWGAA